jgi:hypothetical protein
MGIVAAVITAFIGGFIAAAIGIVYAICVKIYATRADTGSRQALQDGGIILAISFIAQLLILSIPWIYPRNDEVPETITIAAVTALSTMITCWCWAGVTLVRAGNAVRLSLPIIAMLLLPALGSTTMLIGLYVGRFH